jgi:hypothetical protein
MYSSPKGTAFLTKGTTFLPKGTTFLTKGTTFLTKGTTFLTKGTTFLTKVTAFLTKVTAFLPKVTAFLPKVTAFLQKVIGRVPYPIGFFQKETDFQLLPLSIKGFGESKKTFKERQCLLQSLTMPRDGGKPSSQYACFPPRNNNCWYKSGSS